ncbi:hypothetical protein C3B58_00090 [Lactonifactor longoviformis]|uniref:Proline racemase n=1 Tax=Lactonifactor longoviformis DSM 17459 TaxID=1122155 RepID=A0A1M4Z205_9CLOT|nr:proline racemase family protein [Lactonifactor longoviformis]POP35027.1 hypothetical protein C3B58_00090 [Lactonifactor longoviformis]SHF11837.1 Proline racemase [Lactonifactor longoviformis DSM 17459]
MRIKRMFNAVEVHEGEPMRVITGGVPYIPGSTLAEQRLWLMENDDQIRKLMLTEPRGIPASVVSLIVPAKDPRADVGAIFMCGAEYPMVSGATVMATATALLETGMLPMQEPVTNFVLDTPAGPLDVKAECRDGKVISSSFINVPSFAVYLDREIDVPTLGKVKVDVAWGGCFYAIFDVTQFPGVTLDPDQGKQLCRISALVAKAAQDQLPVSHPDYPGIGIALTMMYEPPKSPGVDLRTQNVYFTKPISFEDPDTWTGAMDRGVCGTGSCAVMAVLHAKGLLKPGEPWVNEGILGVKFTGRILEETKIGDYPAIVPELSGECWIYGYTNWILDDTDPFQEGFTVGDIW